MPIGSYVNKPSITQPFSEKNLPNCALGQKLFPPADLLHLEQRGSILTPAPGGPDRKCLYGLDHGNSHPVGSAGGRHRPPTHPNRRGHHSLQLPGLTFPLGFMVQSGWPLTKKSMLLRGCPSDSAGAEFLGKIFICPLAEN